MPVVVRAITYLIPARYYLNILRGIYLQGVGLQYLWFDMLLLAVFAVIVVRVSIRSFRKRID
jgi:ABC-2 type transport system permease protein